MIALTLWDGRSPRARSMLIGSWFGYFMGTLGLRAAPLGPV